LAAELGLRVVGVQVFLILLFYDHLLVSTFKTSRFYKRIKTEVRATNH
jgi:hypothetical protein